MKNKYFFNTFGIIFTLGLLFLFGSLRAQNRSFLNFDGDDSFFVNDASNKLDIPGSDWTIELWVFPTSVPASGTYPAIASRKYSFELYFRNTSGNLGVGIIALDGSSSGFGIEGTLTSGTNYMTLNQWHHIAVSSTKPGSTRTTRLFIDGTQVGSSTDSDFSLDASVSAINFGARYDGSYKRYVQNCDFDEIRYSKIARYTTNFSPTVYDNQFVADANTILLYHLNEGTGTSINCDGDSDFNTHLRSSTNDAGWSSWRSHSSKHLPLAHEWTGGTNTDWGTAGNWNGGVPADANDVLVPKDLANYPSVNGDASTPSQCNNLLVESGASLTVPVGKALTVNGNLTNNAAASDLTISSDVNGNGSLIVNGTVTGSATVQRYLGGYHTTSSNGWHEIASPVNNMPISGSSFVPGSHDDLYAWDEANNVWSNYRQSDASSHPFTTFANGEGYLIADSLTATEIFTSTLNNGDISKSNLSRTTDKGNGWHLLGNPYSSALKWGTSNWDLNNVAGTAKVWNESEGNYNDVAADGIIPSTNGFFVQVTDATNSLTIPAADRIHDATNNYKSASATQPAETLQFKVTSDANGYYDESRLGFKPNATEGFDPAFDSHKLFSMVKTAPSLWTKSDAQDFSTDYLPETTTAYDVPLHFKPGVSTVYHLTIKGADSFDNTGLVLEDLKTGEKIDLSNTGSYDFSAEKGDDVNRFVLHINGVTAVPNVNETDGIQVFSNGNTVYLHGQNMLNGKVSIFNTLGQKVYDGLLNGAAKQQIRINRHKGIYFVRVEENNHVFTKKVFIQ